MRHLDLAEQVLAGHWCGGSLAVCPGGARSHSHTFTHTCALKTSCSNSAGGPVSVTLSSVRSEGSGPQCHPGPGGQVPARSTSPGVQVPSGNPPSLTLSQWLLQQTSAVHPAPAFTGSADILAAPDVSLFTAVLSGQLPSHPWVLRPKEAVATPEHAF